MINRFTGDFAFLSNFAPCKVVYENDIYNSVEHAYQAAKTLNKDKRLLIRSGTAGQAKKIGKGVKLRDNWDLVKISIMRELLIQKFSQEPFKTLLENTKNQELIEGNYWGDTYWGVFNEKGENNLGKLLMEIRATNAFS